MKSELENDLLNVSVKYLSNDENMSAYVPSVGGGETPDHAANYVKKVVPVHNARLTQDRFTLDRQGFTLVEQRSAVSDFFNDNQIVEIYEREIEELVKKESGATAVSIFDHTRRAASEDVRKQKTIREPASTIHNDYTAWSGPNRLKEIYRDKPDELEKRLKRRFAIVNVWRSMHGSIENFPLAVCDASSTAADDLIAVKRQAKDRIGEIQMATYNPDHRWYYYPRMTEDEALLFKTYDSIEDGRARFTIHTSFDDPLAPSDALVRQSIETRCFVFY